MLYVWHSTLPLDLFGEAPFAHRRSRTLRRAPLQALRLTLRRSLSMSRISLSVSDFHMSDWCRRAPNQAPPEGNRIDANGRGYDEVAERFGPILDAFQIDPSQFAPQFLDPAEFAREFGDRIYHVHVKDEAAVGRPPLDPRLAPPLRRPRPRLGPRLARARRRRLRRALPRPERDRLHGPALGRVGGQQHGPRMGRRRGRWLRPPRRLRAVGGRVRRSDAAQRAVVARPL